MNFDFGSRIKPLRLSRSMTQDPLVQKLGVSAQAVGKWVSGTNMLMKGDYSSRPSFFMLSVASAI
jgi:transcriptional regulator with XRE-family HTH domain